MASLVAGAAIGVAFEAVSSEARIVIKKAIMFKRKLKKITKKLEALDPYIKELTRLNEELDMSKHNKDFLQVMADGEKLLKKLAADSEKNRWWYFPTNTGKLAAFDGALGDLLQILQVQSSIVGLKTFAAVNNRSARFALPAGVQVPVMAAVVGGGCCEAPMPPRFDVGLDLPLRKLRAQVLSDAVVVVTAPPGCGKTTLVQKLCKDDQIREWFNNNILFVKVSRKPDLSVIVGDIHKHYGQEVPNFRDEEGARNSLELLLRNISPVLLVLDDVWSDSDTLIDKFLFEIRNYKILVTSRFEFPQFKPPFNLEALSDDDATALFRYHAKSTDQSNIHKDLVKQVVKKCMRCPLALKVIGSALCGQPLMIWRRELEKWSKGVSSVIDFKTDLLRCLESSIQFLGEKDDNLKNCFIDLGSFPEDRGIPATALIDIWTQLYGLEEKDVAAYLYYLSGMNMATLVVTRQDVDEEDDYYSEHFLTLHDMLRELAIHQSKQKSEEIKRLIVELPGSTLANMSNDNNARLLSISTDGLLSSEWRDVQLSETEVLVLNFLKEVQALPEFIQTMTQLKVLILTNYGFSTAPLPNFQLLGCLANLKKIRLERVEIHSLASIKFENLQKLSFFMCKFGKAFSSIDSISEVFQNLEELNIDYCGDLVTLPNGLTEMNKMKKLSVTHCHKLSSLPKEIGEMGNLEVLRLRSCIDLTELPDSICELSKLNFLDISDCFSVKSLPEDIGKLGSLTKLNMKGCSRLQDLPPSVLDFEKLEEVVCDEEIKELWELYIPIDTNIELIVANEHINLNFLYY